MINDIPSPYLLLSSIRASLGSLFLFDSVEILSTIISFTSYGDACRLSIICQHWKKACVRAAELAFESLETMWDLERIKLFAYGSCQSRNLLYLQLKDSKSIELDTYSMGLETLESLGCDRNGGSRVGAHWLQRPLWSSDREAPPAFDEIKQTLIESIPDKAELFGVCSHETSQDAFADLVDVASNPGVYGTSYLKYDQVAHLVEPAFRAFVGRDRDDPAPIQEIIDVAAKECLFFFGDAARLWKVSSYFSAAEQWVHFVGCVRKDRRTVVLFSFDESD